jgi:DNA-binding NarL/FixJ family response regulator
VVRVVVVDDQAMVREGLAMILGAHPDIEVVAQFASGTQLLADLPDAVDVVLLDLYMPEMSGLTTLRRLSGPRVLMLTTIGRGQEIRQALAAGAAGFVLKESTGAELAAAVLGAHEGMTVISPAAAEALCARDEPALTPREQDVLALLGTGLSNKDIANRLGLAERTVKVHVGNILGKLGVPTRTQAALRARAILNG